jgi:hypothetical protein
MLIVGSATAAYAVNEMLTPPRPGPVTSTLYVPGGIWLRWRKK